VTVFTLVRILTLRLGTRSNANLCTYPRTLLSTDEGRGEYGIPYLTVIDSLCQPKDRPRRKCNTGGLPYQQCCRTSTGITLYTTYCTDDTKLFIVEANIVLYVEISTVEHSRRIHSIDAWTVWKVTGRSTASAKRERISGSEGGALNGVQGQSTWFGGQGAKLLKLKAF